MEELKETLKQKTQYGKLPGEDNWNSEL